MFSPHAGSQSAENTFTILFAWLLAIFLAVFCFAPKLTGILFIPLILAVAMGYILKVFAFRLRLIFVLLLAFFALYAIGTAFTYNSYIASRAIETKLPLLFVPLLFSFESKNRIDIGKIALGLGVGTLITGIISLRGAFACDQSILGFMPCFTGGNFSQLHHPSYFSVILLTSACLNCVMLMKKHPFFKLAWVLPLTACQLVLYLLCFSMAGLIFLTALLGILLLFAVKRRFGKAAAGLSVGVFAVFIALTLILSPRVRAEFGNTFSSLEKYLNSPENFLESHSEQASGDDVRLIMWTVSWSELKKHPFGVGTGNVDEHLGYQLNRHGLYHLGHFDEHRSIQYNPHNQYLQTGIETGIQGLLLLLLIMALTARHAYHTKNWVLLILVFSLAFNSLFESMLQRASGVTFYTLMICLLIVLEEQVRVHFSRQFASK